MTRARAPGRLRIGLVNNMPDAALEATERQFLAALGGGDACDLQTYHASQIRRGAGAVQWLSGRAGDLEALLAADLDGVIVTGAEPTEANLAAEALYPQLTRLADHALRTGLPVLWSCLAAHAVAYWLEGVERRRLVAKLSGVFPILPRGELGCGAPSELWFSPHSRWNALDAEGLERAGFQVLADGAACGVDTFRHPEAPGFLFLQGHPEYGAESLLAEYRRDLARAEAAGAGGAPPPPHGCLPPGLERQLRSTPLSPALALGMLRSSRPRPTRSWAPWAERLFGSWLGEVRLTRSPAGLCDQAASNTAAIPCPPPMHIVSSP